MKRSSSIAIIILVLLAFGVGGTAGWYASDAFRGSSAEQPIHEGPIHSAHYEVAHDGTGGFTQINDARAVPGSGGSFNEKRYGKLYRDFLIVTKPAQKGWGVQIIPTSRLLQVQFRDE